MFNYYKTKNISCKSFVSLLCMVSMILSFLPIETLATTNNLFDIEDIRVDQPALQTIYDSPARDWESEALPLGNGFMGASIFGGVKIEEI